VVHQLQPQDKEFARRFYSRMSEEKLGVWYVPEDAGGEKLHKPENVLLVVLGTESPRPAQARAFFPFASSPRKPASRRPVLRSF
jgi:hypothetical protein